MPNPTIDIDYDEVIALVAKEQQAIISKDDPIFTTVLLNNVVIEKYLEVFRSNVEDFSAEIKSQVEIFSDSNEKSMHALVRQHAPILEGELRRVAKESAEELKALINDQLVDIKQAQAETIKSQKRLSMVSIIASAISLVCLCGTYLVMAQ